MMNKISRTFCGVTTALLFTLSLSACGDDSSSNPDYSETNSSAIENTDLSSAGNDDILSSSDVPPTSSNASPTSSNVAPASSETTPESSSATQPTSSAAIESSFNLPDDDPIREAATDAKAEQNNGPAVAPSVVKVKNADGTVTFRDDGADIYDFNSVTVGAELFGDTLVAHVEFSDPTRSSFVMGTLTFTVSNAFADINYLKYDFRGNVKPVREVEELLPCGSNASCEQCPPDMDCGGIAR
ncbi:MAG: hypothetical protein II565_12625 [Fibrobacter sp.]|nr:hypothetical protein [Fibrobacter sp.]